MSDPIPNIVVNGRQMHTLLPGGGVQYVPLVRPAPCIVILIHGVNDIGEAFPFQEQGICAGLNARLDRGDNLQPANYTLPPVLKSGEKFAAGDISADPDKVYFARSSDSTTSPIIPFLWGFREVASKAKTKEKHGEYLDQYGNRIDKRFAKNGGPFANATNNVPDMFGRGFVRNFEIRTADPEGPTHALLNAPPRQYMVLAAQRMASLIRIIRKKSPHEPINIVAHSQGCFVTILAHAMLAKEGKGIKADTIILNNWPYSVDAPALERIQAGDDQQTAAAREETLIKIIKDYITSAPATEPPFATLKEATGVVGEKWRHNGNLERDNRGKVYLYCSPDDLTVGLGNIEGIGWWGLYDGMLERLGGRFMQRVFASPEGPTGEADRKKEDKDKKHVGDAPHSIWMHFTWTLGGQATAPRKRRVNAEALPHPFLAAMGASAMLNSPIDAAIAVANPYHGKNKDGMVGEETPEQAKARWMNTFDANSYHSSIVSNPMHSEFATAYDLCIGVSGILVGNDLTWIRFLRAVADWRSNWWGEGKKFAVGGDPSFPPPAPELIALLDNAAEIDPAEKAIIEGNYNYYCIDGKHPGTLPDFTMARTLSSMAPHVKSETTRQVREAQEKLNQSSGGG